MNLKESNIGGEGGIRTLGTIASTPDFESGTFDHSATSPNRTAIIATNRSIHATCAIHPNGTLLAKPDKAPSENVLEAENFDDLIKAA